MEKFSFQIKEMLSRGVPNREIRKLTGASGATVSYHAKKLGLGKGPRAKYDWKKVQLSINAGRKFFQIRKEFGMSAATLSKARKDGRVQYLQKYQMTSQKLIDCISGKISHNDRRLLRKRLIEEGMQYECKECGLKEWNGKKISLELDHIDGDARNNNADNFRLLCPNCHSQTSTWRGRNVNRY
jgi:uncharacterized protein YerC/Zn finger protein HypA/HybF involved in hydrogenase expression